MQAIVAALEHELEDLRRELREDPRILKIRRIEAVLELYCKPQTNASVPGALDQVPDESVQPSEGSIANEEQNRGSVRGKNDGSKASKIKAAMIDALSVNDRMHRTELLKLVIDQGLMGREKRPLAGLAAYLSEWRKDFVTDGKGNFSLARSQSGQNGNSEAETSEFH